MTMTEWFVAELDREAAKTRRVLAELPEGKREWKPHDRSMAFGYLTDLVANILSWVGLAITLEELDVAPKSDPCPATPCSTHSALGVVPDSGRAQPQPFSVSSRAGLRRDTCASGTGGAQWRYVLTAC
jgi:hypothetical protein